MSPDSASLPRTAGLSLSQALEQHRTTDPTGRDTAQVVEAIAAGAVEVDRLTRQAGLAGVLGDTGEVNVQGEVVQRLDQRGTEAFVGALRGCSSVAALVCEEIEEMVHVRDSPEAPCVVAFDPVDGSSNIDVAVTIGSIFGIYRRDATQPLNTASVLRPGRDQVAAVYAIYGSSTVLVVALPGSVQGFTLDAESGQFMLSHPSIRLPDACPYYSVNEGNQHTWGPGMQEAVAALRGRYGLRYVGSLVADFHRGLIKGGVFLYPGNAKKPDGKLRLLYEASPLAFVVEQAGGAASNGHTPILDLLPEALHQRTPLFIGNSGVVHEIESIIARDG